MMYLHSSRVIEQISLKITKYLRDHWLCSFLILKDGETVPRERKELALGHTVGRNKPQAPVSQHPRSNTRLGLLSQHHMSSHTAPQV